jgi:hypothetical protein
MSRWYQSLYWRVAIGFVLCLAAMLVVQGMLFVWVVSRGGPMLAGQPPDRFAQTVAGDLSEALDRDRSLDVAAFIKSQFGRDAHPFFVMLTDGRVISNGGPFSDLLLRMARGALQRRREFDPRRVPGGPRPFGRPGMGAGIGPGMGPGMGSGGPGIDRGPGSARGRGTVPDGPEMGQPPPGEPGAPPFERYGGRGLRGDPFRSRPVPVIVNGEVLAVVVAAPVAPFSFLLARYAPTLALVAVGTLLVGGWAKNFCGWLEGRRV